MIELHGTMTFDDLKRFQYFQLLRSPWWLLIAGAFLAFIPFNFLRDAASLGATAALLNAIPFALLWLFWVLGMFALSYFSAKKQFAELIYLHQPLTYTFTQEGVVAEGTGFSSKEAWSIVRRIQETGSLFLLYRASSMAVILPKRFFKDPDEIERWRQLVTSTMGSKPIDKPGFIGRWC